MLKTPTEQRTGLVFRPQVRGNAEKGPAPNHLIKIICAIGEEAKVVVHVEARTGKVKYASAHDFRRAFGDRWALRVVPPVLMQLMRHESIETTMRYYVGRNVKATADVVWEAYSRSTEKGQEGKPEHDTSHDNGPSPAFEAEEPLGATWQICLNWGKEAPPGFEPGNGGFAIRCPNFPSIEIANELGQNPTGEVPVKVPSSSGTVSGPQFPPDLARVVAAWDRLPEAIKAGILALIQAAGGPNG
ncbi:MAG TPA: hypothetical protein VNK04_16710 [Gemmataceae bacterium]|nr:hypothetical protein [Gemmataceae bacterium]